MTRIGTVGAAPAAAAATRMGSLRAALARDWRLWEFTFPEYAVPRVTTKGAARQPRPSKPPRKSRGKRATSKGGHPP